MEIDEEKKEIRPVLQVDYEDPKLFGEGITLLNETTWIELTWMEKKVRLLDRDTLKEVNSFD